MTTWSDLRPATWLTSTLAALTTWVTLLTWTPFAEHPAGFTGPLLFGCALVAVSGMLLRPLRVPAVLVAAIQVVLVLLWLHIKLVGDEALGGLVPTPGSVHALLRVFHDSSVAAQTFSSPVPASVPIFYPLLILAGSATAVLVDFLAVGCRRAPLAGLPLLAAYTAPVSILDGGVSWVKFAAAAVCFVFLITAEQDRRVGHWGHRLTPGGGLFDSRAPYQRHQGLWSAARRIGLTTTALAVVAPLLVPSVDLSLFSGGNGTGDGNGGAVSVANPMVDLKRDLVRGVDVDLLTIRTTDPDPSYLRISVLDSFDGNAWRPSRRAIPVEQRADGAVAPPPGLDTDVRTTDHRATVQVGDAFDSRWLPTPYPVASVQAPGDWRYDKTTLDFISAAEGQTTAGLRYRLRSLTVSPTAAQLAAAGPVPLSVFTPGTRLPARFPKSVRRLATSVTEGRTSKLEQAVALQQWFRVSGGFRYSLQRSAGNGTDALLTFLGTGRNSRVGYCEQFAAAMAVMGRALGIPSRVAVGFLAPQKTGKNTYVFSSHDLHAWPEMYFGGIGWVRFEPTPAARAGHVPAYTTGRLPSVQPTDTASAPATTASANAAKRVESQQTAAQQSGSSSSTPVLGALVVALGVLVLLVALVGAPRAGRSLVRRRRWSQASDASAWVEAAWAELRDTARDLGLPWPQGRSVRTIAAGLERSFADPEAVSDSPSRAGQRGPDVNPEATASLHRLAGLLERARYSRHLPDSATTSEQVHADLERCLEAMRAGVGSRRRWRAAWLPGSVLRSSRRRNANAPVTENAVDEAELVGAGSDRSR
jgi:transglutaminase-like putative cysteine protease